MNWADAFPNLLIGLREGLEAGLVVSILLAAVRKAAADQPIDGAVSAIWLGVAGAISLAGSFAAVLTFSTTDLSSAAQEAVGGTLSVLAVVLVTGMIFWMRRSAATLSAHLRGEVSRALQLGSGALAVTAFLAVGREGLETTLFLWTAVRASGQTTAPLVGAALGLAIAVLLCTLLYRQAVRINLGVFFNRTALALIVIAAGVLAYGLGDLQDAGLVPGRQWVAFDLTGHVDAGAWWVALVSGVTDLALRMTVLQVSAWVLYLAIVATLFVRATHQGIAPVVAPSAVRVPGRWERLAGRRRWLAGGALVAAPALVATLLVMLLPASSAGATAQVSVTSTSCAPEWTSTRPGQVDFAVDNRTSEAGEINLDDASGGIVAEIETIGPATTASMSARLGSGTYQFHCLMSRGTTSGPQVSVAGGTTNPAVLPVTAKDLAPANDAYRRYAAARLEDLSRATAAMAADLRAGDRRAAETDWLRAQDDWERVGASYDSFGTVGEEVDGLPDGLPGGVDSSRFTGLHRLEHGLYGDQSLRSLIPVAARLQRAISTTRHDLASPDLAGNPADLPIRAHEILEDALRDHLSGIDDEGAHAAYPMTYADTQVTRVVLTRLRPLIAARASALPARLDRGLDTLDRALLATRQEGHWVPATRVGRNRREDVDAAVGALLQNLSEVPALLEVPPRH